MNARYLAIISIVLQTGCSTVPPLSTEPGKGPSVAQVTNHINCELANIADDVDEKLVYRESQDPSLRHLIPYLKKYHFVASILMTVDTLDSEGISPSSSFIHPFSSAFSRAIGLGGQLNGSQERNSYVGYSIDLDKVGKGCVPETQSPREWLNGTLNLADIIADGLTGLDSTSTVNIYGSGGPAVPAYDTTLENLKLHSEGAPNVKPVDLTLSGALNFSPASDALQPGGISFTGKADVTIDGKTAVQTLTMSGSTVSYLHETGVSHFSLSGTLNLTDMNSSAYDLQGASSTISLVGKVIYNNNRAQKLINITGAYTTGASQPVKYKLAGSGKDKKPGSVNLPFNKIMETTNVQVLNFGLGSASVVNAMGASGGGGAPASAQVTVKNAAASQATAVSSGRRSHSA